MSHYYDDYASLSRKERDRSPYKRREEDSYYRERERVYERERRSRSLDRYKRRSSPSERSYDRNYERERENRDHYAYKERRETEYPSHEKRKYEEFRRIPTPPQKKSEYEIEYDPKTRTFQAPGKVPLPAYTTTPSLSIPNTLISPEPIAKHRKSHKGPIVNYFESDIMPNEKVKCPYNDNHIVQRKRLQSHILYCRKKFPNTELKICPLNVLHVIKEEEMEDHILNCPDREIVKYLSYEPNFAKDIIPEQGLIESVETWDDEERSDYDPNIIVEKMKIKFESAIEMEPGELSEGSIKYANVSNEPKPTQQVEINGEIIKIKQEENIDEVNENETMALVEEQLNTAIGTQIIHTSPPVLRVQPNRYERLPEVPVKVEWSKRPERSTLSPRKRESPVRLYSSVPSHSRHRTPSPHYRPESYRRISPSLRRSSPSLRRRSPSPYLRAPSRYMSPSLRRRSPSPRRMSPSSRRRSPSPYRRAPSPRRRSPASRHRSPSPRRRSPGYYKIFSPSTKIKRESENDYFHHSRERSDTIRKYDRSPPPYRVKDEFNRSSSSRHDPYVKYEEDKKSRYAEYYHSKSNHYDEKRPLPSKDVYIKREYDHRRYEERRRSPSPKAYRVRSRSPVSVRYERPMSRSPPPRSKYGIERSPRYDHRRTPPPQAPPKSSKDYYDMPTYGGAFEKDKNFRKNSERQIKAEQYSLPKAYKIKESQNNQEDSVPEDEMIYTRQA